MGMLCATARMYSFIVGLAVKILAKLVFIKIQK